MAHRKPSLRPVGQRLFLAVVGGYFLTTALVALSASALSRLMARNEAVILTSMLGFVLYLILLIWAFADSQLQRLWCILGGGALLGHLILLAFTL